MRRTPPKCGCRALTTRIGPDTTAPRTNATFIAAEHYFDQQTDPRRSIGPGRDARRRRAAPRTRRAAGSAGRHPGGSAQRRRGGHRQRPADSAIALSTATPCRTSRCPTAPKNRSASWPASGGALGDGQDSMPVLIDDALGFTAPQRPTETCELFDVACTQGQVIVRTCVPEPRYSSAIRPPSPSSSAAD